MTVCLLYFGDKSVHRGEPNLMKPSFGTFRDVLIWKNKLNSGMDIWYALCTPNCKSLWIKASAK